MERNIYNQHTGIGMSPIQTELLQPKPEKKLLSEIAHLTNLLHGSKLKPSLRAHHPPLQHHHHHLRKVTPVTLGYAGKRMNYRAPYVRLNGNGGGSNRKLNLVVSKRFRSLRCPSSSSVSSYRSGSQSSSTCKKFLMNKNHTNNNNSRKVSNSKTLEYLTRIALTKLKFRNSTGRFSSSYFSTLPPATNSKITTATTMTIPATTNRNPISSSQISLAYQKIKNFDSDDPIIIANTTTTSTKTFANARISTNNNNATNFTNSTTKTFSSQNKQQQQKPVKKEPEKSNRYYEIKPKSSPIQAIVQRRHHPDSISIRLERNTKKEVDGDDNDEHATSECTNSNFKTQIQLEKQIQSTSPSSSSSSSGVDDDDDNDSQMISSCQEEGKSAISIDTLKVGPCGSNAGTKCKSNLAIPGVSSCICDICNPDDDDDVQIIAIKSGDSNYKEGVVSMKGSDSLPINKNSNISQLSSHKMITTSDLAAIRSPSIDQKKEPRKESNVSQGPGQIKKLPEDNNNSNNNNNNNAGLMDDPRRNRLLSKLSKLSSYKERRLNEGKSQMPSYLPF